MHALKWIAPMVIAIAVLMAPRSTSARGGETQAAPADAVAQILVVKGEATVYRAGQPLPTAFDMYLHIGDELQTGPAGRIVVRFTGGSFGTVPENSRLSLTKTQTDEEISIVQLVPVVPAGAAAGPGEEQTAGLGVAATADSLTSDRKKASLTETRGTGAAMAPRQEGENAGHKGSSVRIVESAEQPVPGEVLGQILEVTGEAFVDRYARALPAEPDMHLYLNDEIRTGEGARVIVKFMDESFVTVGGLTRLAVEEFSLGSRKSSVEKTADLKAAETTAGDNPELEEIPAVTRFWFPLGILRITLGKHPSFIKTPTALLSTEGIEQGVDMIVTHEGIDTDVYVLARHITVINRERADEEPVLVRSCRHSTIRSDLPPSPSMPITSGMLAALFVDAAEIQSVAGASAGLCFKRFVSPWKTGERAPTSLSKADQPASPSRP